MRVIYGRRFLSSRCRCGGCDAVYIIEMLQTTAASRCGSVGGSTCREMVDAKSRDRVYLLLHPYQVLGSLEPQKVERLSLG